MDKGEAPRGSAVDTVSWNPVVDAAGIVGDDVCAWKVDDWNRTTAPWIGYPYFSPLREFAPLATGDFDVRGSAGRPSRQSATAR